MTVQEQYAVLFVGLLFLGMLVCLEIGLRLGRRTKVAEGAKQGLGIIEGAMFTLLGLLVAFTFSGAAERFEKPTISAPPSCVWICCQRTHSQRFGTCSGVTWTAGSRLIGVLGTERKPSRTSPNHRHCKTSFGRNRS